MLFSAVKCFVYQESLFIFGEKIWNRSRYLCFHRFFNVLSLTLFVQSASFIGRACQVECIFFPIHLEMEVKGVNLQLNLAGETSYLQSGNYRTQIERKVVKHRWQDPKRRQRNCSWSCGERRGERESDEGLHETSPLR